MREHSKLSQVAEGNGVLRAGSVCKEGTEPNAVRRVSGGFMSFSLEASFSNANSKSWYSLFPMVLVKQIFGESEVHEARNTGLG